MKIAFIDSKLNLKSGGGSNYSLHLVASQLANLGHQVMVITLCPALNSYPDNLPYAVVSEGLVTNRLDKKYRLALQRVLCKYKNEVDIYHLWEPWLILDAAMYRGLGGKIPIVAYLNSYSFCTRETPVINAEFNAECYKHCGLIRQVQHREGNLAKKALFLPFHVLEYCLKILFVNQVDAFIAISPAVAEIYTWHKINPKKIVVIPPGIDYEYLYNLKHNHPPRVSSSQQYRILYVGRLSQEKGVDILLNAASRLEFPLSLDIVGDGPQRTNLESLAKGLGILHRVTFHGWVDYEKVVNFYLDSQLFIHPGRWPEPLGRTVLDAMALGVPVIASDSGGPPWALGDAGLTFRPGDCEHLAEKIRLIHGNPSLAADLIVRALQRAKDFDCRKTITELLSVYEDVIDLAKKRQKFGVSLS